MKLLTITEQQDGDAFTFYDNALGTILRGFEGFEYSTVRESIDDVAGPYGSTYITSKFGRRRVAITGDLISDDVFSLRRDLVKALRQTGTMKLVTFTTYDDLNLQFEGEVVKVANPYTHKTHTFLIEIIAPDWRFYSQEETTANILLSFVRGGAEIPATIPMAITENINTDVDLTEVVINEGSEMTDPIFTISGPGTDIIVRNETTEQEFTINTTLVTDDVLVIDVKNRTVVLNGTDNYYPFIDGDFWSLVPGENEIRFFADGFEIDVTALQITYRHAYGGI